MSEPNPAAIARDERLLPISNQRFGWWLFLSAGMMMFAGVMGASLVLRSGLPASEWPQPSWVKSHWCIGMVTIVLLLSICWFLWREQKNRAGSTDKSDSPAPRFPWIIFALVFAAFSISVIGLDYQSKLKLGLCPNRTQPMVYAKPDLNYLSSVSAVANDRLASLEQLPDPDSLTRRKLKQWRLIRDGSIEWTRRKIGLSDDPTMRTLSLNQLANQIYSTRPDSRLAKFAQDEKAEAVQQLETAKAKLIEIGTDDPVVAQSTNQSIDRLQSRLSYFEAMADTDNSIRDVMRESLPKVIPGGPTWIANYWLLTGFLSVELLIGTCLLAFLLLQKPPEASAAPSDSLQNVTAFWYFVAATGIIVATLVWIV